MLSVNYFKNLNFVSWILLLLFSIQLGCAIWAIDRGFDFTDEAFGYLSFKDPEEITRSATFYAVIYDTFFGWINLSIINVRIIRLLLLLVCGLVFGLGLTTWIIHKFQLKSAHPLNLCLFILIGSLLVNAAGTQSFTYNLFSTLLLQLIAGVFFFSFQRENTNSRKDAVFSFILGALIFALFTVKFSNAILISIVLWLFILYDKKSLKAVVFFASLSLVGAICMDVIMFKSDVYSWLADYIQTLKSLSDKTNVSIWERYEEDFQNVKTSLIIAHAFYILIIIIILLLNQFVKHKILKIVLACIATFLMGYVTYKNDFYLGGQRYIYTVTFFYILAIFILFLSETILMGISVMKKRHPKIIVFLIIVFLIAIPFIGAIGTNNLLSVQIIWYTSFLFGGLYLLLYSHEQFILSMLILLIALNATIQSVSGLIYFPYRIKETLLIQSNSISPKISDERVMVDEGIKNTIENAQQLITSKTTFSPGDPIFSFSSELGLIYFLNGTLPGWHWYKEQTPESNCESIRNSRLNSLHRTILILPASYKMDSTFNSCLHDLQINFPVNYIELGEIPYVLEGSDRPLKIYAPHNILKN